MHLLHLPREPSASPMYHVPPSKSIQAQCNACKANRQQQESFLNRNITRSLGSEIRLKVRSLANLRPSTSARTLCSQPWAVQHQVKQSWKTHQQTSSHKHKLTHQATCSLHWRESKCSGRLDVGLQVETMPRQRMCVLLWLGNSHEKPVPVV